VLRPRPPRLLFRPRSLPAGEDGGGSKAERARAGAREKKERAAANLLEIVGQPLMIDY